LIADSAGNLYGTTALGGVLAPPPNLCFGRPGCGTVFKLSPSSTGYTETVLYAFPGVPDGQVPFSGLIADNAGNLYGTTGAGGTASCNQNAGPGCGTFFKLSPSGTGYTETVNYSFAGFPDAQIPLGGLLADSAGNLYGTSFEGGTGICNSPQNPGCGTVFKLSPSGTGYTETVLYSFAGPPDGGNPTAGVFADSAGNLYGTTFQGGIAPCAGDFGCGTIFKLSPSSTGYTETVLYSFAGSPDGALPVGGLLADSAGNLYGTTEEGGIGSCNELFGEPLGCGTVFKLSPSGTGYTETLLYRFTGSPDGASPSGLIADAAGNFYGATSGGGAYGFGTVFKLSPSGTGYTETVLYSFTGSPDGAYPNGGLLADGAGNLYGTTVVGGVVVGPTCAEPSLGCGTVFKLTGTGFVTTPAQQLAALLTEVTGVGPGMSLADKVAIAQTYYSANDVPNTCSTLGALVNEVTAQNGKSINQSSAKQIVSDAQAIQSAIGCK
jgi:uncharacterized repeat protein (TIGR03803 family)